MEFKFKKGIDLKKLPNFLDKIYEEEFEGNKDVNSTPWQYINDDNVDFYHYENEAKEIIGVMVIIRSESSNHFSFLYILKDYRNHLLGKKSFEFYLKNYKDKNKIFTSHVIKSLAKTIEFHKKLNYQIYDPSHQEKEVINWRNKCLKNDKNYYKNKFLMWRR